MNRIIPALPDLVQTPGALAKLRDDLGRQARIAVDTESNSLHAYKERVCLLQFSTLDRDYVVDPLALDDLQPLADIFSDPQIEKIFHAAEYDIICLRRDFGFGFANIFDTMQAGRILGRKQAGLDRLLAEKLDVKVNKHFQKADWGVRPLSSALLLYAALDTHYLILLRDLLDAELRERGLRPLAQEDFDMACDGTAPRPKPESQPWEHFARGRGLNRRDLTVVKHVLSCREHIAARLNRPPFKVVDDERVVEIAKAKPSTLAQLKALGLTARQVESWGSEVLAGVQAGLNGPLVTRTALRAPSGTYLRRLERLKAWRKKAAAGMEVESDVVLPRGLMLALAEQGSRGVGTVLRSSPWRLQHFGDAIAGILVEAAA